MSLQWQAIAGLLYFEVFFTILLIIPIFSPARWKKLFNFQLFARYKSFWKTVFYACLGILIVLFVDSIRIMMKYNDEQLHKQSHTATLDTKLDYRLRECKGQRNFYITGFSLFLMFVIHRLIVLLYERASLEANHAAILSQAQNTSKQLQDRLEEVSKKTPSSEEKESSEREKEKYLTRVTELEKEVKKVLADRDAMRKQAESVKDEYDRLSEEYQKLQNKDEVDRKDK